MEYYVYQLTDPRTNLPFYIGKSKKNRMFDHLKTGAPQNNKKHQRINEIRATGVEPIVSKIKDNLTEKEAYDYETTLIAQYGREGIDDNGILTNNRLHGWAPVMVDYVKEKISAAKKGVPLSEQHKAHLSKAKKGRSWIDIYGVDGALLKKEQNSVPKGEMTESRKHAISNAKKGKVPHGWSNESRKKVSQTLKGRVVSEEQKTKLKAAATVIKTCPHCGITGSGPSMQRWHFNNCKDK